MVTAADHFARPYGPQIPRYRRTRSSSRPAPLPFIPPKPTATPAATALDKGKAREVVVVSIMPAASWIHDYEDKDDESRLAGLSVAAPRPSSSIRRRPSPPPLPASLPPSPPCRRRSCCSSASGPLFSSSTSSFSSEEDDNTPLTPSRARLLAPLLFTLDDSSLSSTIGSPDEGFSSSSDESSSSYDFVVRTPSDGSPLLTSRTRLRATKTPPPTSSIHTTVAAEDEEGDDADDEGGREAFGRALRERLGMLNRTSSLGRSMTTRRIRSGGELGLTVVPDGSCPLTSSAFDIDDDEPSSSGPTTQQVTDTPTQPRRHPFSFLAAILRLPSLSLHAYSDVCSLDNETSSIRSSPSPPSSPTRPSSSSWPTCIRDSSSSMAYSSSLPLLRMPPFVFFPPPLTSCFTPSLTNLPPVRIQCPSNPSNSPPPPFPPPHTGRPPSSRRGETVGSGGEDAGRSAGALSLGGRRWVWRGEGL